jgi:hypothetical protein
MSFLLLTLWLTGSSSPQVENCPRGPVENYMLTVWQQCWFAAAQGRWRTLNFETHIDSLVVEVEAANLADADEIAKRWVKLHGDEYRSEIVIYVRKETPAIPATIRRVSWSRTRGFSTLEFPAEPRR